MTRIFRIWSSAIRVVLGALLIGLITFVCYRLQLNLSVTGFVSLLAVVLQLLAGNFASSAVVSVVAVLCLDFFFTLPRFSFEVTNPLDIRALISFVTTGYGLQTREGSAWSQSVSDGAVISTHHFALVLTLLSLRTSYDCFTRSL